MTTDKAFKRAVRERMLTDGVGYTEARRALLSERGESAGAVGADPIAEALRPGRVVGFVCGGGFVNLALAMPYLVGFEDRGHHLTYVMSAREGLLEVPSPFDFICARGLETPSKVAEILHGAAVGRDPVKELLARLPDASSTHGPMADARWRDHLRERGCADRAPVVWVEDVQAGPPLLRGGEGGFDGIEAQLTGLRQLAAATGTIMMVAHCMPGDYPEGWEVVVDGVDDTFVITTTHRLDGPDGAEDWVPGAERRIEHHSPAGPAYTFDRHIDTDFGGWRNLYVQAR
jgi:hypothetical protein